MNKYISDYVLRSEYACRCGCGKMPYKLSPDNIPLIYEALFERFEMLRDEWGKPIKIASGFRCPVWNEHVSGEKLSIHLFGLALDLDFDGGQEVDGFAHLVESVCPELRMGVYTIKGTFIHIDVAYLIQPQLLEAWREGVRWSG